MADNEKLGSTSPQILLKNATNLDKLVNGRESESLSDRFAVLRRTWYGMEMAFNRFITYITGRGEQAVGAIGWQELGNWATGLTVDNRQQIVYYNGSWYKYLGELEHVITGDSPENDGGVWSAENPTGKWSNIGDAALRSNLGSGDGFKLIGQFSSVASLAATSGSHGDRVLVRSYHEGGSEGGGQFVYDESRASENDGVTVFNGWVRQIVNNTLTNYDAGIIPFDGSDATQKLIDLYTYAPDGCTVIVMGHHEVSGPVTVKHKNNLEIIYQYGTLSGRKFRDNWQWGADSDFEYEIGRAHV